MAMQAYGSGKTRLKAVSYQTYLTGVNAIVILDRVAAAVFGLMGHSFP